VQLSSDESLTSPRNTVSKFAMAMKPLLISDEIVMKNIKKQKKKEKFGFGYWLSQYHL
jgi:hypothetical protein